MPAGLVKDETARRGHLGGDFVEVKLHGFAVASPKHECGASSSLRADRAEQVGGLGALIMRSAGA